MAEFHLRIIWVRRNIMEMEKIVAMAVAAVAEETGSDPKQVVIRSFHEIQKSSLEKYVVDHQIPYRKYRLEESEK